MSRKFVTEVLEEKKKEVFLFCPDDLFKDSLIQSGKAAAVEFIPITMDTLQKVREVDDSHIQPIVLLVNHPLVSASDIEQLFRAFFSQQPHIIVLTFDGEVGERKGKLLASLPGLFPKSVIVKYLDVFLPSATPVSAFDECLRSSLVRGELPHPTRLVFPLWYQDVAVHTIALLLQGVGEGKYCFQGSHPTTLEAWRLLLFGKTDVGFPAVQCSLSLEVVSTISSRDISVFWQEIVHYYPLQNVKTTPSIASDPPSVQRTTSTSKNQQAPKRKMNIRALFIPLFGVGCGLFLFSLLGIATVTVLLGGLNGELKSLSLGTDIQQIKPEEVLRAQQTLQLLVPLQHIKGKIGSLLGQQEYEDSVANALLLTSTTLEGIDHLLSAKAHGIQSYQMIFEKKEGSSSAELAQADQELERANTNFSSIQVLLAADSSLLVLNNGKDIQDRLQTSLPLLRRSISNARLALNAIQRTIASKHQTIALVILDANTLRAQGGRVSAVAMLTFERGTLFDSQVYSVSALNKLMTGSVPAPPEVAQFLKTPTWTLDETTWETQMKNVAPQVSWFLGKQLQKNIDGIIPVSSTILSSLFPVSQPIHLGTTNVMASQLNEFEHQAIDQQKNDPMVVEHFFSDVLASLVSTLGAEPVETIPSLLTRWEHVFTSSEGFVAMADTNAQKSIQAEGWDGNFITAACPSVFSTSTCTLSTVLEVENSIGGNSSNAVLERTHAERVRLTSTATLHDRILTLKNSSIVENWPYGEYQGVIKIALPEVAQIQEVLLNEQPLDPSEFTLLHEDGHLLVRTLMSVAPQQTTTLRLLFSTPPVASHDATLAFFEQKQAGTGNDPFTLTIEYPDSYTPRMVAPRASTGKNTLTFDSNHAQNRLFAVGF